MSPTRRAIVRTAGLFVAVVAFSAPSRVTLDPSSLTVHEWGTFTSIAGEDGGAVEWMPLSGPQDLPCFVDRLRYRTKGTLYGTVRMETPVIYFYSPQETTANVRVRFRDGLVTEWFPRATVTPSTIEPQRPATWRHSTIEWNDVRIVPGGLPVFPTESGQSHYYPARATDASPLNVGSQHERFLFYRGVGRFTPPIEAVVGDGDSVTLRNAAGDALGEIVLFENRGGRIAYRVSRMARIQGSLERPEPGAGNLTSLRRELENILVARGLYPKEAAAMLETWRDSWFEEGSRVFYIAPRRAVDAVLPLDVRPRPAQVARVFVGRVELMTRGTLEDVKRAVLTGDRATIRTYGRFLEPIARRIAAALSPAERVTFEERRQAAYVAYYAASPPAIACR